MTPDEHLAQQKRLLDYYEDELRALRALAREFADRHPDQARMLKLRDGPAGDPHVERLLEGVAFLAGRVRARVDDDFPELTDALLGVLYPHLLAPLPSMAVVQLAPLAGAADLTGGLPVPRHTELTAAPVDGVECRFRTGYDLTLWPVEVAGAGVAGTPFAGPAARFAPDPGADGWAAKAVLTLRLRATGPVPLDKTEFGNPAPRPAGGPPRWPDPGPAEPALRVFLDGPPAATAALYEHLFNDAGRVVLRNPQTGAAVQADADRRARAHRWVRPVGFGPDEALLPYPPQAFPGYRVLAEFFAYREKFLFADLGGWADARAAGVLAGTAVEVLVYLDREVAPAVQREVGAGTFRTGCVPAVNLFAQLCEVIPVDHRGYEYPVVPERTRPDGYEVYSIEEVVERDVATGREVRYDPFYSYRHRSAGRGRAYWYARRRASARTVVVGGEDRPDLGTEVDLCFVDLGFDPARPADGKLLVRALCLNRDLPGRPRGAGRDDLRFPDRGQFGAVRVVRPPTPTLRPPPRAGAFWRLVSHLSLNHLSVTADGGGGRELLREYLRLYDFADPEGHPELAAVNGQVVAGLEGVDSRPGVAFAEVAGGAGFARGVDVAVRLDGDKFEAIGAYLFAAVLDEFLRLYASVNSFTRLTHRVRQRGDGPVKVWPARTGTRPTL